MNVVLEGPDNAGKTTLARKLIEQSKVSYFHPGGPPKDWETELECLDQQRRMLTSDEPILVDRVTCVSQQVYSAQQGHGQQLVRSAAVRTLLSHDVLIVYCRPSTDRLMRLGDLTWRPEETEEHKQLIVRNQHTYIQRYDEVMSKISCVHFNFEDPSAALIQKAMVRALRGAVPEVNWLRSITIKGQI